MQCEELQLRPCELVFALLVACQREVTLCVRGYSNGVRGNMVYLASFAAFLVLVLLVLLVIARAPLEIGILVLARLRLALAVSPRASVLPLCRCCGSRFALTVPSVLVLLLILLVVAATPLGLFILVLRIGQSFRLLRFALGVQLLDSRLIDIT